MAWARPPRKPTISAGTSRPARLRRAMRSPTDEMVRQAADLDGEPGDAGDAAFQPDGGQVVQGGQGGGAAVGRGAFVSLTDLHVLKYT